MDNEGLSSYVDRMERWSDRVFLVGSKGYRKKPWTYRAARSAILALSEELGGKGLREGGSVILQGPPSPEWVVAYFAVLHRGAVVVPVDTAAAAGFFDKIAGKVSPAVVIGETAPKRFKGLFVHFSRIEELGPPATPAVRVTSTGDQTGPHPCDNSTTAEIVFTSGTTSDPKGVVLTHGNILSNLGPIAEGIEKFRRIVGLLPPFRFLCTVPYSHMFGQAAGIFLPILLGSTVFFTRETGPASLIREIKRNRILTLVAVPRVLKLLADHVKAELAARGGLASFERRWDRLVNLPYPLRALFFMDVHRMMGLGFWSFIVGGAPLDGETHEFWRRLVFSVFQGYGLTEAAPMVTMFNPFRHDRKSVGKLFPGQEVKLGPDGEILIRGGNVMAGYFGDPTGTAKVFDEGWLRTGDIGEIDSEGHLFIRGRVKDMICTSDGHNVFAEDVESALRRIRGVRDAAVLGRHGASGETVHAVLILEEGAGAEGIVAKANSALLPYQRIRSYDLWKGKDFPRTATQKVKKAEVAAALASRASNKAGERNPAAEELLEGLIPGTAGPDALLVDELGLDSLDLVEVVARVERKYGVSVDESVVGRDTRVSDLEKLASGTALSPRLPMPRWASSPFVRFFRRAVMETCVLPGFRALFRVRGAGLESVCEREASAIIASNHISNIDPVFVLLTLPWRLRGKVAPAMGLNRFYAHFSRFNTEGRRAKTRLAGPLHAAAYGIVTFLFQTFPFPQGTAYRPSLEYTGELLDRGNFVLIFPEGEVGRSRELGPGRFRGGIARIAEQTDAPVVPAAIARSGRRVTVTYGPPQRYAGEGYEAFASKVESVVGGLLAPRAAR